MVWRKNAKYWNKELTNGDVESPLHGKDTNQSDRSWFTEACVIGSNTREVGNVDISELEMIIK